jgi:hypothetical protein
MKSVLSQRTLTRVVQDNDLELDIAQIHAVMSRIQSSLRDIPRAQREYVANALLNMAVSKMIKEEGGPRTASLLMRLGDVVANNDSVPTSERAIDLSRVE